MQVKQVAELLGVDNKEVIKEVEARREDFSGKGFKIAKKLNASSALEEDLVRHILANFDLRQQQVANAEKEADGKRRREEEERQRAAFALQRQKDEEERQARAEAAHKHAEAELARKQAELKAQEEAARKAAEEKAAQEVAAAAAERARKAAEPVAPPVAVQAPAPPAPAAAPSAPPAQAAPQQAPRISAPGTEQRPGSMPPRAPQIRPGGGPPREGGYQPREGAPRPQGGYPPREGGPRPQGGYPPREGGYQPREGAPRPPGSYPPREGGPRPQGGYPPREGGYQPRGDQRPGAYPPREGGRPPYTGGPGGPGAGPRGPRPQGPGGPGRGDRPQGPGGQNRFGPPGGRPGDGRGGDGRPARAADLQNFVNRGLETDVSDDFKRAQARRSTKPTKPTTAPASQDWEKKKGPKVDDKKRIRPSQIFNPDAVTGDRRPKPRKKGQGGSRYESSTPTRVEPKVIRFGGDFTVGEFGERTGIGVSEVMKKLFLMGEMLTINQLLDPDKAEMLALEFEVEISIERESDENDVLKYLEAEDAEELLIPRPPVVTIMGHVDHGKTSLLDRIRKADVAAGEFGGITQHIGAYLVATPKGQVAFLDTPGHEAFTEMRSRGANVTDLVVLVVAANDGVMPQTVEAINHAKAAGVSILVAINKIDVNGANPERVKQELMKYELVPEEYGGETIMIPVSAATGEGVDNLLEYIALQTEVLELKANPNRTAQGTVVESHVDPLRGAVATILVEDGTLRVGDAFLCGTEYGRVRAMRDDRDHSVESAGPAHPVEIIGLSGSPVAGEKFLVVPSEAEAREIAERRQARRKNRKAIVKSHISLDNLADRMTEGDILSLNLIVKGDVQGSIEAISSSLMKIKSDKVLVRILHSAVGAVSLSDVQLADASEAIILAFNVGIDPVARTQAEEQGVDIRSYQIIYALLEDIQKAMLGLLKPEFEEKSEGRARVQQTFKVSKVGTVAGCMVEEGVVAISHQARLLRGGSIIWRGKLRSLRRVKDDAKQVLSGVECGIGLENYNDVKEGDIIETFSLIEKTASLMG